MDKIRVTALLKNAFEQENVCGLIVHDENPAALDYFFPYQPDPFCSAMDSACRASASRQTRWFLGLAERSEDAHQSKSAPIRNGRIAPKRGVPSPLFGRETDPESDGAWDRGSAARRGR